MGDGGTTSIHPLGCEREEKNVALLKSKMPASVPKKKQFVPLMVNGVDHQSKGLKDLKLLNFADIRTLGEPSTCFWSDF